MILDNRTVLPDIVVSRDVVPNNRTYNLNNNVKGNVSQRENITPKGTPKKNRATQRVLMNNNDDTCRVQRNGNVYIQGGAKITISDEPRRPKDGFGSPLRRAARGAQYPALNESTDRPLSPRRRHSSSINSLNFGSGEFDGMEETRLSSRIPTPNGLSRRFDPHKSKVNFMNVTYTKEDFKSINRPSSRIPRKSRNSIGLSDVSSDSLEGSISWNWNQDKWNASDSSGSWGTNIKEYSREDYDKQRLEVMEPNSCGSQSDEMFDSDEIECLPDDNVSYLKDTNVTSKMVVIKCQDNNYLTRILMNKKGIDGVKVLGRLGLNKGKGMSVEPALASASNAYYRDGDPRSHTIHPPDNEFEHEAADYQWLLDYEYRESYSKESLCSARDNSSRVSVLQTPETKQEFNYETISRNIDANLAEIDMDDFRSEDINQLLALSAVCSQYQDIDDDSGAGLLQISTSEENQACYYPGKKESSDIRKSYGDGELGGDEEECSGISGELSFYQSGPLFSPLKEPPQIPPSFSVDSLDDGSIHDDLILTCQANKDNYTIAFEGSFIHMSENSDYHENASRPNDSTSPHWATDQLHEQRTNSDMCRSDQPYTTWSRVSRRSSNSQSSDQTSTPVRHVNSPICKNTRHLLKEPHRKDESKSNSMPNLMRRSLMRRSLETSGHCVKVYDLQNSLRTSQLSNGRSSDCNNFSLVRLFMKQKSLSKDAASLSSSCTDPSQEEGCSTSDNQSGVESSDWPMNSQSENDMDGSTSPLPSYNQLCYIEKTRKLQSPNIISVNDDETSTDQTQDTTGFTNNNNNITHIDITNQLNMIDNANFDDSLKEINVCSKPPMTSPIREEPEGMDISVDNKRPVIPNTQPSGLILKSPKVSQKQLPKTTIARPPANKNKQVSHPPEPKDLDVSDRTRQDSSNSANGNQPMKGPVSKTRPVVDTNYGKYFKEKPKPLPRSLKQFSDQSLQTSNLKVSAGVNTSGIMDKKDVYVYYPNYALPDLSFLKEKKYHVDARIFLVPQKYNPTIIDKSPMTRPKTRRPFSMNDISKMKQNLSHIKDLESLNCLLPKHVKEILEDPTECMETHKPSFCFAPKGNTRPVSHHGYIGQRTQDSKHSSSSLNSTQPSSGYRGSSTMLTDTDDDKHGHSSGTEIQQGLPKGVLRKCTSLRKRESNPKEVLKRRSLPEMENGAQSKEATRRNQSSFGKRSRTLDQISDEEHHKDRHDPIRCTELHSESGLGSLKHSSGSACDDPQPIIYDKHDKKTLVISVRSAVEKLVTHFKLATSRERMRTSSNSSEAAQIALDKLCPAIYALLSDGMLPCLSSLFGKITNSVWKVIEATSQLGPSTKALNDLVMTLNSEECLSEGPLKFNAFIFGLLNLRSVDAWLSFLRTRETTLQKHYHPDSFLYLSNTAMRGLYDDLIQSLKPLALLPIQLDILFEYETLHVSLLKMEERLVGSIPVDVGMSLFDHLLAAKESKELRNTATQQDRVRALVKVLSGSDVEMRRSRSNSPRPRSCCEEEMPQQVSSGINKRWSNVQLGSKLLTALDKLMVNEGNSSSDYTDSIDNPRRKKNALKQSSSSSVDISEKSATDKDTENEKGLSSMLQSSSKDFSESEGERFRRLQLKWEQMAICNPKDKKDCGDRSDTDKSISPGCVSRSRIPRPVGITSPQAPLKPFEPSRDKKLQQSKQGTASGTPRKSLKEQDLSRPTGLRAKQGYRAVSSSTNRASSVPGRGMDRGLTTTRYESKRRGNVSRSVSQGRNCARNDQTRLVQTLHHRLATDNGHLSFNRGDILTMVIEVDDKYVLCCHNDRKGLVPKSAVIPVHL